MKKKINSNLVFLKNKIHVEIFLKWPHQIARLTSINFVFSKDKIEVNLVLAKNKIYFSNELPTDYV